MIFKLLLLRLPSWDGSPSLALLSPFLSFIFCPTSLQRQWAAFLGYLMSAASDQKLFCELCSAFNCSFDEFVGEKVVSPSYSSAILAPQIVFEEYFDLPSDTNFTSVPLNSLPID